MISAILIAGAVNALASTNSLQNTACDTDFCQPALSCTDANSKVTVEGFFTDSHHEPNAAILTAENLIDGELSHNYVMDARVSYEDSKKAFMLDTIVVTKETAHTAKQALYDIAITDRLACEKAVVRMPSESFADYSERQKLVCADEIVTQKNYGDEAAKYQKREVVARVMGYGEFVVGRKFTLVTTDEVPINCKLWSTNLTDNI